MPFGTGLMRDERHADHLLRDLLRLVGRFRELDAAALAASACMNLRLDDDNISAEAPRDLAGFSGCERHFTTRDGHTEPRQD